MTDVYSIDQSLHFQVVECQLVTYTQRQNTAQLTAYEWHSVSNEKNTQIAHLEQNRFGVFRYSFLNE